MRTGRLSQALAAVIALGVFGAAVFLAVIAVQYSRNDRPIVLPNPRGSYAVGRTVADWTDARRSRELMVFIWYPAPAGARGDHAAYIPGKWGTLAAEGYVVIPARRMETIAVGAIDGAPVAPGSHPILVLLPAMGRAPAHYTTLAEDLASHGYVVAGVAPTGSTRNVVFPSGRLVEGEHDPDASNAEFDRQVVQTWIDDAGFTVDQILATRPFADVADRARIGILGHSFGGAVAMQILNEDSRFKAAANLDGSPWRDPVRSLDRPLLILLGGQPPAVLGPFVPDDAEKLRAICKADRAGCEIQHYEQAGYADFSDDAVLPSQFPFPERVLGRGRVNGEKFQRQVADRLLAFFGRMGRETKGSRQ